MPSYSDAVAPSNRGPERLREALALAGQPFPPGKTLKLDGSYNRWGDERSGADKPLWCQVYLLPSNHLAATFGDWRQGTAQRWRSWEGNGSAGALNKTALQEDLERRRREVEAADQRRHTKAAALTAAMWRYLPEQGESAYLARKQAGVFGIRFGADDAGAFVAVPVRDIAGQLKGLQRIYADGGKFFLPGTAKRGCFHLIDELEPGGILYLVEGYATGASVHQATAAPVAVCFDAGNLKAVADALKAAHPELVLIVAADNDQWKAGELGPDGKPKGNAGVKAAQAVAKAYPGTRVAVPNFMNLDTSGQPTDFNDLYCLAGPQAVRHQLELINKPAEEAADQADETRRSQADLLVQLASAAQLFHDAEGNCYASIPQDGHTEHWPTRTKPFKDWLVRRYWLTHGKVPGSQAMQDALAVIDGLAQFDGPQQPVYLRVAEHDSRIYLDLCAVDWRAVEVDAQGWRVVDTPPVRFLRNKGMAALPAPRSGGSLAALWDFLNVGNGQDRLLVSAWLVQALRPTGPYPVLCLQGEQGTAKSTATRLLRRLIDPSVADLRTTPKDERDLLIAARNGHVIALDNLSGVPTWLSDALCRLATGGGFSTRQLYTDVEEVLINVQRPIALNGIDDIASRQDLIDRCIILNLDPIPDERRLEESALWKRFDQALPALLGALLGAVSAAIKNLPATRLDRLPRMADFARWATAAESVIGKGFLEAYQQRREEAVEAGLEGSAVAVALRELVPEGNRWEGTATKLLNTLEDTVDERTRQLKSWPKSAKGLSSQLKRLASALRSTGLNVAFAHGKARIIKLDWVGNYSSDASIRREPSNNIGLAADESRAADESPTNRRQIQDGQEPSSSTGLRRIDANDAFFPTQSKVTCGQCARYARRARSCGAGLGYVANEREPPCNGQCFQAREGYE